MLALKRIRRWSKYCNVVKTSVQLYFSQFYHGNGGFFLNITYIDQEIFNIFLSQLLVKKNGFICPYKRIIMAWVVGDEN